MQRRLVSPHKSCMWYVWFSARLASSTSSPFLEIVYGFPGTAILFLVTPVNSQWASPFTVASQEPSIFPFHSVIDVRNLYTNKVKTSVFEVWITNSRQTSVIDVQSSNKMKSVVMPRFRTVIQWRHEVPQPDTPIGINIPIFDARWI